MILANGGLGSFARPTNRQRCQRKCWTDPGGASELDVSCRITPYGKMRTPRNV